MKARAAVVVGLLAAAALSPAAGAATRAVRVGSYFFEDSTVGDGQVVLSQGDSITFGFEGDQQHTATVDGMFDSGVKNPGQTYTTGPLMRPGSFTLYCQFHGAARHSTTLVIRASASPSPTPTRARPSPTPTRQSSRPTRSASPKSSPSQTAPAIAAASPSVLPSDSASADASPSRSPALSTGTAAPPSSPTTAPSATTRSSPSTTAFGAGPPDVTPATALDDSGRWWLPAGIVLLAVLVGAAAIAVGRRRRAGLG